MQRLNFLLFLTIYSTAVFGQKNYDKFKKLFKNNDTAAINSLITEWEKTNPNDPELYTSAINYYFSRSTKEILSLDQNQNSKESLQVTDSTGKVLAYINADFDYDMVKLSKALQYANIGIEKFPNRLDIRFGKSYMLLRIEDYENFTKEIIKTVEYSRINKNKWLWTENKPKQDAERFMLSSVQGYLKELYDTENDNLLPNMVQIGDATLKYYNNIQILSTTAVALMLTDNHEKAIRYLKRAEKLNPKDFIVLNNIAQCYKQQGDKANAIKYYQLTEKYGDEQAKKQAKQNLQNLKN